MKRLNETLCVIGGGQMARALVGGMFASGLIAADQIRVVEPSDSGQQWWRDHHADCLVTTDQTLGLQDATCVLIAVKPQVVPHLFAQSANGDPVQRGFAGKLIISIAAGVKLETYCHGVGHERVIRVMPNTPCLVGEGAAGFCLGPAATKDDAELVRQILQSVGECVQVTERQLDAVTAVSGSGPAYLYMVIEAMADGGVAAGLPRDVAMKLASQTVRGAATMVQQTGHHPGLLKDQVCSPGGTTIAAVSVLEEQGLRSALIRAVHAAAQRSSELG